VKVPEFELHAEISVVEIVHGCVPCDGKKRGRGRSKTRKKAPSVTGGAFCWVKQCHRVATRYDKLAANYLTLVKLASIRIW
jgi:hypothetical protein